MMSRNKWAPSALGLFLLFSIGAYLMQPRGIRNNNPLNIRQNHTNDIKWLGESLDDHDAEFEEFESPFYGLRAAARVMRTYKLKYNAKTIRTIVERWAPPNENDTESYIRSVSQKTGLAELYELSSADEYAKVIAAMVYHENGRQPYDADLILNATKAGLA